jgi:hypothetical protein
MVLAADRHGLIVLHARAIQHKATFAEGDALAGWEARHPGAGRMIDELDPAVPVEGAIFGDRGDKADEVPGGSGGNGDHGSASRESRKKESIMRSMPNIRHEKSYSIAVLWNK